MSRDPSIHPFSQYQPSPHHPPRSLSVCWRRNSKEGTDPGLVDHKIQWGRQVTDKQNTKCFRVVISTTKESNSMWRQKIKSKHMESFTWKEAQDRPPWESKAKTQRMRSTHYVKTGANIIPGRGSCTQRLEHGKQRGKCEAPKKESLAHGMGDDVELSKAKLLSNFQLGACGNILVLLFINLLLDGR